MSNSLIAVLVIRWVNLKFIWKIIWQKVQTYLKTSRWKMHRATKSPVWGGRQARRAWRERDAGRREGTVGETASHVATVHVCGLGGEHVLEMHSTRTLQPQFLVCYAGAATASMGGLVTQMDTRNILGTGPAAPPPLGRTCPRPPLFPACSSTWQTLRFLQERRLISLLPSFQRMIWMEHAFSKPIISSNTPYPWPWAFIGTRI